MARGRERDAYQHILHELNAERASALLRISRTLESLIAQLHAARERIAHAGDADRERELTAFRELRAQAAKYRWYLEVQRESLGLHHHRMLDEFYEIPPVP